MTHKLLALLLVSLVAALSVAQPARATTKDEKNAAKRADQAAKVKANIAKLGTGPEAHIDLKRRNGTRVVGYVSGVQESAFVVTESSGVATVVPYDDVAKVKGHNLSTGLKIAIGAGAAFALVVILILSGAVGDFER